MIVSESIWLVRLLYLWKEMRRLQEGIAVRMLEVRKQRTASYLSRFRRGYAQGYSE
ncbi:hypothetical protein [Granulicella sp. WH15]|uniref:hypothetical protein n=1 Tax=Granulicella sp. WH15 TaxID=2602070 RepID=UPI0013A59594|nr:hypothetical protein [Granulicella sp. WH15]